MFALSLVCGLPRTFHVKFLPRPAKGLGSPRCTGTEKGPLCTTREVTTWWFYLQVVLAWNFHILILCDSESLSGIWTASKTKGKPSQVTLILSAQKGPQHTTQEPGLVPRDVLLQGGWTRLSSKGMKTSKMVKTTKTKINCIKIYYQNILEGGGMKNDYKTFFCSKLSNFNVKSQSKLGVMGSIFINPSYRRFITKLA